LGVAVVVVAGCGSTGDTSLESNAEPFAHPGTGSTYLVGTTVSLDGSRSFDPDGDAIEHAWTIESSPPASAAVLEDAASPMPRLELDVVGDFEVRLAVTDSSGHESTGVVLLRAEPAAIEVGAGADRVTEWRTPVELAASIAVEADRPALVEWELVELPAGSTASIAGADQLTASFVPDLAGRYVARITAETPFNSRSDEVEILAHGPQQLLDHAPIAMIYAESIDRIVTASNAPPVLRLLDPVTGTASVISLPSAPRNLSLGLGGARVAVGHDNAVSIVTLEPPTIDQTVAVATLIPAAVSCELGSDDLVHCVSQSGLIEPIRTIDLAAGTTTDGAQAHQDPGLRLHPSASRIYVARRSNRGIDRYDSASLPVSFVRYFAPETTVGRLWPTHDGASMITGIGVVLHSSDDLAVDTTRRAILGVDRPVASVAESLADGRIAVVTETTLFTFDGGSFETIASAAIPATLDQWQFHPGVGELVAYRSDGSELYLVADTEVGHVLFTLDP
jgi:hypothetical protein